MEKMDPKTDGATTDIVGQNMEKLKELFPDVFTDGKVDFDVLRETLGDYVDDLYTGRLRELDEFGDVRFEFVRGSARRDRNQDRTLGAADLARPIQAAEFVFDVADPRREIDVQLRGWRGCQQLDRDSTYRKAAQRTDVRQLR